jgi:DNA topoisomerase VI subunit B
MAVSENNVSTALTYLAMDPHPVAVAKHRLTMAENKCRETYGKLFLTSEGTSVAAKEASVESNPIYVDLKQAEADAVLELERHRSRVKAAEMLLEVWRTENANARAAERIR